jgi:hypothetical protein
MTERILNFSYVSWSGPVQYGHVRPDRTWCRDNWRDLWQDSAITTYERTDGFLSTLSEGRGFH